VTDGSGGDDINGAPAAESQDPTSPWQRHASGYHEAGHDGTEKHHGFTTTIRKATKQEPTESNKALTQCAAHTSDHSPELNKAKAKAKAKAKVCPNSTFGARTRAHSGRYVHCRVFLVGAAMTNRFGVPGTQRRFGRTPPLDALSKLEQIGAALDHLRPMCE
jgi:hypothetical protein